MNIQRINGVVAMGIAFMMKRLIVLLVVLFVMAGSSHAAESFLLYGSTGGLDVKELVSDGSGGYDFAASVEYIGIWGDSTFTPLIGDIDGDGYNEFVRWNSTNGVLDSREFVSDGSGGLEFGATITTIGTWGGSAYTPVLGDIDGDGTDEFIIHRASDGLTLGRPIVSDGSGGLEFGDAYTIGSWGAPWNGTTYAPLMGDIDGDGADEFLLYGSSGGLDIKELVSDGSDGFVFAASSEYIGTYGGTAYRALMGDIDGDGYDEFVLNKGSDGATSAKAIVSDGSSGLEFGTHYTIGNWGAPWSGTTYTPLMGNADHEPPPPGTVIIIK